MAPTTQVTANIGQQNEVMSKRWRQQQRRQRHQRRRTHTRTPSLDPTPAFSNQSWIEYSSVYRSSTPSLSRPAVPTNYAIVFGFYSWAKEAERHEVKYLTKVKA